MQRLGLIDRYEWRFLDLVSSLSLLAEEADVAVDSYPIEGAGQVLDTYNLLGAAINRALRRLAQATGRPLQEVANELDASAFTGRSVKGKFDVDWSDPASKRRFLADLVAAATRVQDAIRAVVTEEDDDDDPSAPSAKPAPEGAPTPSAKPSDKDTRALLDDIEHIDHIIERDVERDDGGQITGIVQGTGNGRLISITDPDMRHGRKSASVLIAGFKANVIVSVIFGWLLLTKVFGADEHDGADLPTLTVQLEARHGLHPATILGDHAYGTLANHLHFSKQDGPTLFARMARPTNGGRFTKDEFVIDLQQAILTCPGGHTIERTRWATRDKRRGWLFEFGGERCGACPLRTQCVSPKAKPDKGRSVFVDPKHEPLIRAHLAQRDEDEFKEQLARRVAVEHRIAALTQCGGKQVHRFGIANVDFDVRMSSLATNLRQLGAVLRTRPELRERLDALVEQMHSDVHLRARVAALALSLSLLLLARTALVRTKQRHRGPQILAPAQWHSSPTHPARSSGP